VSKVPKLACCGGWGGLAGRHAGVKRAPRAAYIFVGCPKASHAQEWKSARPPTLNLKSRSTSTMEHLRKHLPNSATARTLQQTAACKASARQCAFVHVPCASALSCTLPQKCWDVDGPCKRNCSNNQIVLASVLEDVVRSVQKKVAVCCSGRVTRRGVGQIAR
jgi:hypothetical protein